MDAENRKSAHFPASLLVPLTKNASEKPPRGRVAFRIDFVVANSRRDPVDSVAIR
jgi:hypothetical protein